MLPSPICVQKMLKELQDSGALHGTLDQIEEAVAHIGDQFRKSLQEQIVSEALQADPRLLPSQPVSV
jgi:hypothetical protein